MESRKTYKIIVHGSRTDTLLKALHGFPKVTTHETDFALINAKNKHREANFHMISASHAQSGLEKQTPHDVIVLCPAHKTELDTLLASVPYSSKVPRILVTKPTEDISHYPPVKRVINTRLLLPAFESYYQMNSHKAGDIVRAFYNQLSWHLDRRQDNMITLIRAENKTEQKAAAHHTFFHSPIYDKQVLGIINTLLKEEKPLEPEHMPLGTKYYMVI